MRFCSQWPSRTFVIWEWIPYFKMTMPLYSADYHRLPQQCQNKQSWPLNPIKHLWDQLGRAVCARVTNATTLADLRHILVEEWDAIPQQRVVRLVTSMRRRCEAVVAVYVGSTWYWDWSLQTFTMYGIVVVVVDETCCCCQMLSLMMGPSVVQWALLFIE